MRMWFNVVHLQQSSVKHCMSSKSSGKLCINRTLLEKVQSRKYRAEHQLFVAEGQRIIREALQHGATPEALYFSRLKLVATLRASPSKLTLEDVHALSDLPLIRAPYKTLQTWSSVTTSPGIIGQFSLVWLTDKAGLNTYLLSWPLLPGGCHPLL